MAGDRLYGDLPPSGIVCLRMWTRASLPLAFRIYGETSKGANPTSRIQCPHILEFSKNEKVYTTLFL